MPAPVPNPCSACRYFTPNGHVATRGKVPPEGDCRRFPPVGSSNATVFPTIFDCEQTSCGEYRAGPAGPV